MTDPRPELLAATRLLVQWGRTRQTVWHDPSRDLLAALGDRHASFSDFSDHVPDAPPVADRRAAPPRTAPLTTTTTTPTETIPCSTTVAAGPPAASPTVKPAPLAPSPTAGAPPSDLNIAQTPAAVPPVTASPSRARRRVHPSTLALAAALVLAVAAVPAVWRSYSSSGAPVAPSPSRVVIDSNPPGSVVLVNNVERGKTPLVLELPAGVYRVQLRHRKNIRNFDLEVVAGMPAEATVDWTKKPVIKRKAAPQTSASTKTAAVTSPPTATAKATVDPTSIQPLETGSPEAAPSEATAPEPPASPKPPTEAETAR